LGSPPRWRFPLRRALVPGVIVLLVLAAPLWLVARRLTAPPPEVRAAMVAIGRAESTARQAAAAPAHTPRRAELLPLLDQSITESGRLVARVGPDDRPALEARLGAVVAERDRLRNEEATPPAPAIAPASTTSTVAPAPGAPTTIETPAPPAPAGEAAPAAPA